MNKQTKKILLIFITTWILACTESKTSKNSETNSILSTMNVGYIHAKSLNGNSLKVFDLSDLNKTTDVKAIDIGIENIQYIPLERRNDCLVAYIGKIAADDNSFYISSVYDIKRFDSKGKFITKIGQRGRGPTEYPLINDFSISFDSNVYVLSRDLKKIFVYSNNDEFIKTIPAPNQVSDLCCYNDEIVCYSTDIDGAIDNSFQIIDYDGKIKKQIPNRYKFHDRIRYRRGQMISFCENSKGIFIKEQLSDTIFKLSGMNLNPKYVIVRGGKLITRELLSKVVSGPPLEIPQANYIVDLRTIILEDYIYLESVMREIRYGFIAKLNDSLGYLMKLDEHGIINDYDGGPDIFFKKGMGNNTIINWIDAYKLINYVNSNKFKNSTPKYPEKKIELEKLANSLDENDNPVLMLVKLNE